MANNWQSWNLYSGLYKQVCGSGFFFLPYPDTFQNAHYVIDKTQISILLNISYKYLKY